MATDGHLPLGAPMPNPNTVTILSIDQLEDRSSPALLNFTTSLIIISPPPPPPPATGGVVVIVPLPPAPGTQANTGGGYA